MEQDTAGPATGRDDSKKEKEVLAHLLLASIVVLALISPPVAAWVLPGAVMAVLAYRGYATQREQRRRREDLIEELETSLEEATASSQMKDDFIATVSHELRTPLTAIQGSAKTLLQADVVYDEETQRMLLEAVDRQSERLRRLIEDLLVAARMDWRGLHAIVGPVSLSDLTRQVVDGFGSRIETHRIRVDTADGPLALRTDKQRIEQILSNLLDNALKYSPRGSTVTVSVRRARNGAEIAVADEGPGVPENLRDKIFERFYQADQTSTRAVGGTGLGLWICRRLTDVIGGTISMRSGDEGGSVFTLWVPARPPADAITAADAPTDTIDLISAQRG